MLRVRFLGGRSRARPVDRATRRGGNHPLGVDTSCRLKHVDRPEDVDRRVEHGVPSRDCDRSLRSKVVDLLGREPLRCCEKRLVPYVDLVEVHLPATSSVGEVGDMTGREIVNDEYLPPFVHESIDEVRPDEARAAGHHRLHRMSAFFGMKRTDRRRINAGIPSRHEIFLPSVTSRPV